MLAINGLPNLSFSNPFERIIPTSVRYPHPFHLKCTFATTLTMSALTILLSIPTYPDILHFIESEKSALLVMMLTCTSLALVYFQRRGENWVRYEGPFKNGLYHGEGTLSWPDGSKYVGQFQNGQRQGQGTHTFPNGTRNRLVFNNGEVIEGPIPEQKMSP